MYMVLAALLCLASVFSWAFMVPASVGTLVLVGLLCVSSLIFVFLDWMKTPSGHLIFDGRRWAWQFADAPTDPDDHQFFAVSLALDFQMIMLVRFVASHAGPRFLWLQRSTDPTRWHTIRCALHAPQARHKWMPDGLASAGPLHR